MILTLSIAVAVGTIWLAERSFEHLGFAIAALCFNAALILLVAAVVAGGLAVALAASAASFCVAGVTVSFELQILIIAVALAGLAAPHRMSGGTTAFQRIAAQPPCFFSTFIASLLDPFSWQPLRGLALIEIASDGLSLTAAVTERAPDTPDIIVIQHKQCGEAYFASSSERKRRFHRTLVEMGIIDLAPSKRQTSRAGAWLSRGSTP